VTLTFDLEEQSILAKHQFSIFAHLIPFLTVKAVTSGGGLAFGLDQ